jgi:hypothetical protein
VKRTAKVTVEPLRPRIPVDDYAVKGVDGWALKRGNVMRRLPHYSASLGAEVPGDLGRIVEIYRRETDGPVLLDLQRDESASCGLTTWPAGEARRSDATVKGWMEALGFTEATT